MRYAILVVLIFAYLAGCQMPVPGELVFSRQDGQWKIDKIILRVENITDGTVQNLSEVLNRDVKGGAK